MTLPYRGSHGASKVVNGVLVVWQPFFTAYQGLAQKIVELRVISVGDDAKIVPLEEPHPSELDPSPQPADCGCGDLLTPAIRIMVPKAVMVPGIVGGGRAAPSSYGPPSGLCDGELVIKTCNPGQRAGCVGMNPRSAIKCGGQLLKRHEGVDNEARGGQEGLALAPRPSSSFFIKSLRHMMVPGGKTSVGVSQHNLCREVLPEQAGA